MMSVYMTASKCRTTRTVVLLELAYCMCWVYCSYAQLSATLVPKEVQGVCPGQTIAYNCIGNGSIMKLFCPPIVNESGALILHSDQAQTCEVRTDTAAAIRLLDTVTTSFTGTLTLSELSGGSYNVYCHVSTSQKEAETMTSTSFSVLNASLEPAESNLTIDGDVVYYGERMAKVNVSWSFLEEAELFMIQINETDSTLYTVKNYVLATLPYGTFLATMSAMNRCGRYYQNFSIVVERVNETTTEPKAAVNKAAVVIAGIEGALLFIILCCCCCCCIIGCVVYWKKDSDNSEYAYHGLTDFDRDIVGEFPDLESSSHPPRYDDVDMLPKPRKLCVHSANSIERQDINSGDKIILSLQVLMSCAREQEELSYPISFKLEHPESGQLVYAGVSDFNSPLPEAAYLPQWMMEHLGVGEGEEITFVQVELPQGTFVKLQPVSSTWLGIPHDTRTAMMELHMKNYQTLTEGTKITLTYELNRYTLKVLECKPSKGILIVNIDLPTDIVEPADFNRHHSVEEGQAVSIELDKPVNLQLEASCYRHFVLLSLPGQTLPSRLHVEVKSIHGDPDLFLCQSCTAPSQTRYTWCNQDVGDSGIQLSTDEKGFDINKPLYAGVVSLCVNTEFTITFHKKDPGSSHQAGKTLRDHQHSWPDSVTPSTTLAAPTPSSRPTPSLVVATPIATPPPPGHEHCSSCGCVMPSLRLIMHERHCEKSTYKCPICEACMPKVAEKKHHLIAHKLLICECGQEFTQLALHHHQQMDCSKRMAKCPWCNLSFPIDQLREHENLCGRNEVPCPVCQEEVPKLEVEGHLEAFHSVNHTAKIDWNKSLASQVVVTSTSATPTGGLNSSCEAPKNFSCGCGKTFQFQDDLQVHQLTECIHVEV